MVRDERHREPPRALPGPPRRDPQAARVVQRGGESGAHGLRGAAPLPATRARVAAERARTDPAFTRETSRARRKPCWPLIAPGGIPNRVSRWCVWPKATRPPRPPPYETPSSAPCGCRRRSDHRTPTCSARRCSRRRSRSRSRPATSAGPDRPPTSWSSSPPDSRAKRWSPAPPSLAEGCGSLTAMRRARNSPCPKRCDSGTKSALRTRRRVARIGLAEAHPRQRQRAPGRLGAPSGPRDPRRDRSRAVGGPTGTRRAPRRTRRAAGCERQRLSSRG